MKYESIGKFKEDLLEYLNKEKEYIEDDIKSDEALSDDEKVDKGIIIKELSLRERCEESGVYIMNVSENNTKLSVGDKAFLCSDGEKIDIQVLQNDAEQLKVYSDTEISSERIYRLQVNRNVLLDPMIALAEKIEDGAPGSFWFEILTGISQPEKKGYRPIENSAVITISKDFNDSQRRACIDCLKRPDLYCIQGPPGTGKTDVLAAIANCYSRNNREVLIICNTHYAVNNALNKIHKINPTLTISKIGDVLKGDGLNDGIVRCANYNDYLNSRKLRYKPRKNTVTNDIVGMTVQSAIVNIGLRKSNFMPNVVLIDEAGQIPFTHGALIGAFKSSSIIFIGDDRQMPPIFHEKLKEHPFSTSIFTYLTLKYPDFKSVLTTTYRMNAEITEIVSKNYYEPYGIRLFASDFSANRTLVVKSNHPDERIKRILTSDKSVHIFDVSKEILWKDDNYEEADFIADLVKECFTCGIASKNIAIVTPYRRQVKAIRERVRNICSIIDGQDLPLIDTVERLQGQDVDMIIISLCTTDPDYLSKERSFIYNENRMNVMISRAKRKVVLLRKPLGTMCIDVIYDRLSIV